jgi:hypothetical protein
MVEDVLTWLNVSGTHLRRRNMHSHSICMYLIRYGTSQFSGMSSNRQTWWKDKKGSSRGVGRTETSMRCNHTNNACNAANERQTCGIMIHDIK